MIQQNDHADFVNSPTNDSSGFAVPFSTLAADGKTNATIREVTDSSLTSRGGQIPVCPLHNWGSESSKSMWPVRRLFEVVNRFSMMARTTLSTLSIRIIDSVHSCYIELSTRYLYTQAKNERRKKREREHMHTSKRALHIFKVATDRSSL